MENVRRCVFLLAATLVLGNGAFGQGFAQTDYSEQARQSIQFHWDPKRDEWQKPNEVVRKLALKPGAIVADIGCGPGYFTLRLARAVGPTGKIYAIDVDAEILGYLKERAKAEGVQNIEFIVAEPHDPKLPPASLVMIFLCNTLHWIKDRARYYPLLTAALKPRARLVDIDWKRTKRTEMVQEMESAGFRLVQSWDFLADQYFLVFEH